ncbi:hypothetical protein QM012_001123 [Aureobasidium pullulans]|uniref:Uncharacterized protein n=1 Tax=Aureobasidium pullulans TaxID=5580 RepID=A0ABR0TFR9_AURPU
MLPKRSRKRAAGAEASTSQAKSTKTNALATAGAASSESARQHPDVQDAESSSQPPNNNSSDSGTHNQEMTGDKVDKDPYAYIMNCAPRFEFRARYNKQHQEDEDFDEGDGEAGILFAREHNEKKMCLL